MLDYFGKNADGLRQKKLWLFDMDGTVYEEDRLFDGAPELLGQIRGSGGKYVFITNNSSRSVTDYIAKLERLGVSAGLDDFFTSAQAAILYLQANYPGARVYCQGTKSLVRELAEAGIDVTEDVGKVDVVLVGFDTELTTWKLRNTCEILSTQEVAYLATNPDFACPVAFGFIPDCGSICGMIRNATGKEPKYLGKPEPVMVDIVREKFRASRGDTVVVGDRLYTDIAAGLNAGVTSVCVLTGEAAVKDIEEGAIKPTFTFQSVKDIYELLVESPLGQTLSERNVQIMEDIAMCEKTLRSGNGLQAREFIRYLEEAYGLKDLPGASCAEKLKEAIRQLMWAIRML